jgi:hypothetical protein
LFLRASLAYIGLPIIVRAGGGGVRGEALIVPTHHFADGPVIFFQLLIVTSRCAESSLIKRMILYLLSTEDDFDASFA